MSLDAGRVGVRADQVDIHGRVTSPSFLNELLEDLPEWTDMPVWVNGTEEVLPSNTSVPVTSPILADIAYPDIRRDNQYFTYRESPTPVDGLAKIKSIKGNTLVWNQLAGRTDSYTTSKNGVTITITGASDKSISLTAQGTVSITIQDLNYYGLIQSINVKNGHKYLVSSTSSNFLLFGYGAGTTAVNQQKSIFTSASDGTMSFSIRPTTSTATDGKVINETFYVMFIDLTKMFGVGKEPATVEEFTSLFPLPYYAYNAGTLLSFNGTGIKTENEDESEEHTTTLPISTYFPTGMKSAGNVYDELTPTKAITRIGALDLGTKDYTMGGRNADNTGYTFHFRDTTIFTSAIPVKCAKFIQNNNVLNWESLKLNECLTSSAGYFVLCADYNDVASLKNALQGVYLYYELATPVELPTLSLGE